MNKSHHSRRLLFVGICLAILGSSGCGTTHCPATQLPSEDSANAVRMRHQILFQNHDDAHVFEGYMLLDNESLYVTAFAGPGVDLFTTARGPLGQCGILHIKSLAKSMDVAAIGDNIARVYLGGCPHETRTPEATCDFNGEILNETYDPSHHLVKRVFPTAHGVGLTIEYMDFKEFPQGDAPQKITLTWGAGENKMVIRLLDIQQADPLDPLIFEQCMKSAP